MFYLRRKVRGVSETHYMTTHTSSHLAAWRSAQHRILRPPPGRTRGGRHTCGNPVGSCHDTPEGDPSANIICGSTSVRRESVDLSNAMTWRQMIGVGVTVRESSLREESSINSRGQNMPPGGQSCDESRKAGEAARARGSGRRRRRRRTSAEEGDATEEEATRERTTRVGRRTARWA